MLHLLSRRHLHRRHLRRHPRPYRRPLRPQPRVHRSASHFADKTIRQ